MADNDLFREPDDKTGPAVMGREPMILPEERKEMSEKMKAKLRDMGILE